MQDLKKKKADAGKEFGNARDVNNYFEEIIQRQSEKILRIVLNKGEPTKNQLMRISKDLFINEIEDVVFKIIED